MLHEKWHKIGRTQVLVSGGRVVRGVAGSGFDQRTVYTYRARGGVWCRVETLTLAALRAGLARGTMALL